MIQKLILLSLLMPALAGASSACPDSFEQFLTAFESDRQFQQSNIIYPLAYSYVDSCADPEPKLNTVLLTKDEVFSRKTPLYPFPAAQKVTPLKRNITESTPSKKTVRLSKPDTDYLLEYHFEQQHGCWKLVKFEDHSL